jgi:hypothetical protein
VALALAIVLTSNLALAACACAQAASPFPVVEVASQRPPKHRLAYVAMVTGAALVGGSFLLTHQANQAYDDYLRETDPQRIETFYDRADLYDRLSSTSLISGELLIVTGLYLRFLRPPRTSRLSWAVSPDRCALSLRF